MNIRDYIKGELSLGYDGDIHDHENNHIVDVRGWGRFQYMDKSEEVYHFVSKFVCDAINQALQIHDLDLKPCENPFEEIIVKGKITPEQFALNAIEKGVEAYHEGVKEMTDRELYFHVFEDYDENDFASKELKKRNIEQFRPCHNCQSGCPVCGGRGEILTFE